MNRDEKTLTLQRTILCRQEFGTLLRRLRLERGLSCEALGEKAGRISRTTLATIERGQRPAGAQVSERLADALGLAGEDRQDFLMAGLKTTTGEILPEEFKGLDPELFKPMWQLLIHHGISQQGGCRVNLKCKLSSKSPEPVKHAARQLAEKATRLSARIQEALADADSRFCVDLEVETRDGTILLVEFPTGISKISTPPTTKRSSAKS
jgi:transcriptional regulator with XRE-family HTH domain